MVQNSLTPAPIVTTKLGKVEGRVAQTITEFPYYSFQGMRYAQPPIGNLRFKASLPATPWEGIWDAKKEGNRSLSFTATHEIIGDEDCLFINVYTPKLPNESSTLLPVMFWVHGGGHYLGSGNTELHSPDYLIDQEVVVVTFNYRLGALGYMAFRDPRIQSPGNNALKDMVMALRWVRDNIIAFNGDPNNVTLWGASAGGIAAHLVSVSPMAQGLFHKAIIQSGTGFVGFGKPNRIEHMALRFANFAGGSFNDNEEYEAYEFLLTLTKEEIIEAFLKTVIWSKDHVEGIVGPTLEDYECGVERFLTQEPELYYLRKEIKPVPMIIGCNTLDGMIYATKEHIDGYILPTFTDPRITVPLELEIPQKSEKCLELGEKIVQFYYGNETPSRRSLDKYSKYQTDVKYAMRIKRVVQLHQYATNEPIYVYRFELDSPLNLYKKMFQLNLPGANHGDELTYMWHTKYPLRMRPGSIEKKTQHRIITFWTNFAKRGNPNPLEDDPLLKSPWKPATGGNVNHLQIGRLAVMKDHAPDLARMEFWDEIYHTWLRKKFLREFGKDLDLKLFNNIEIVITLLRWTVLTDKERENFLLEH